MALWSLSLLALSNTTQVMSMKAQAQCNNEGGFIGEFCNEAQSPVLGGADVVAYRALQTGSRAIQGKPDIVAEYNSSGSGSLPVKNRDRIHASTETSPPC